MSASLNCETLAHFARITVWLLTEALEKREAHDLAWSFDPMPSRLPSSKTYQVPRPIRPPEDGSRLGLRARMILPIIAEKHAGRRIVGAVMGFAPRNIATA